MDVTAADRSKFGVFLILNVLLCSVFRVDAGMKILVLPMYLSYF